MAKRASTTTVSSGYTSTDTINGNFDAVNAAFDNTLSRDGSTPNAMGADLDMNSNDILNARDVSVSRNLTVQGVDVLDLASTGAATIFNTTNRFSGDDTTIDFTLTKAPASRANTHVFINGIYQQKDTYTVSSTTLSFSEAPPVGTNNIEVVIQEATSAGSISASAVSTSDGEDVQAKIDQSFYPTRTAFVADVTAGKNWADGDVVSAAGLSYRKSTGSVDISDLPNWKAVSPVYADHFKENDGSDMTAAIQGAIDSYSHCMLKAGTSYLVTDTITIDGDGEFIEGDSGFATITRATDFGNTLDVTGNDTTGTLVQNNSVKNIYFKSTALTTSGYHLNLNGTFGTRLENLEFQNGFSAMRFAGATQSRANNIWAIWSNLYSGTVTGRKLMVFEEAAATYSHPSSGGIFISNFNVRTNGTNPNMDVGIEIHTADGLWFSNGHVGGAATANVAFIGDSATDHIGITKFSNVLFDANTGDGVTFEGSSNTGRNIFFEGCDLKGGGLAGIGLFVKAGADFINVQWNGGYISEYTEQGLLCSSDAFIGFQMNGTQIRGNSYGNPGVYANMQFQNGKKIKLTDIRSGGTNINPLGIGEQTHGIIVGASVDDMLVSASDFELNTTAPTLVNTTSTDVRFRDCISDASITVGSAGTINPPREKTYFKITGTTTINNMQLRPEGERLTLKFASALTISAAGNFETAHSPLAGDSLSFISDGTQWVLD